MADAFDLFRTAPEEVTRYFRSKRSQPTFDWRDIAPAEHAFSWTVAKTTGFDVLEDIRAAVDSAIINRIPFEQFRTQLTPILQQKGWWGKRVAVDPADNLSKVVQLGSVRRLRTIYWANVRSAHAAGEWERTQRNKNFLPFLVYTLSVAERRRPEHEGWVGIILPVDHPWWNTHYPPNGWGCKCGVRQISKGEAVRLGWKEGQTDPLVIMEPWKNKRSGQTVMLPHGIDPGWDTNPGKARAVNVSEFLHGKVAEMPVHRQSVATDDIVGSPILKAMAQGHMPKGAYLPVAQIAEKVVQEFNASTNLVRLSSDSVTHILTDHSVRGLTVEDFRQAISVVRNPVAVIRKNRSGPTAILIGQTADKWWRAVVKSAANGSEWWLNSFHNKSAKDAQSFISAAKKKGNLVE